MPAKASVGQRRELAARQRPPPRARHQRVDLLLDEAVERRGGAGDERDADRREEARRAAGGSPGVARNIPMTAQKTINDTTRGLVSARKCFSRVSASASVLKRRVVGCGRRNPGSGVLPERACRIEVDFTIGEAIARQPMRDALRRRVKSLAMPLMSGSSG